MIAAAEASAEEAAHERNEERANEDQNARDPESRETADGGEQEVLDQVVYVLGDALGQEAALLRVDQREDEHRLAGP